MKRILDGMSPGLRMLWAGTLGSVIIAMVACAGITHAIRADAMAFPRVHVKPGFTAIVQPGSVRTFVAGVEEPHRVPPIHNFGQNLRPMDTVEPWRDTIVTGYGNECAIMNPSTGRIGPSRTGLGSSGHPGVPRYTAASDPKIYPRWSTVRIAGFGDFVITDSGPVGRHIDLFLDSCEEARQLGSRILRARRIK